MGTLRPHSELSPSFLSVLSNARLDLLFQDQGLVYIGQDGLPVLRSDSWTWLPYGAKRNSVRLESKARFDGGLFIVDLAAMPTGKQVSPRTVRHVRVRLI